MAPPSSHSFRFDDTTIAAAPAGPALELTASDGTGLRLVSVTARIVIDAPLAFTELHLVFENPEPRQLEGRFRIALPPGASLSRFAMRQGSVWQEGEVVERQAARRVYEDFLHRSQDPALLEHESGNEFSARVFPILPSGRKELILSYGHELPTDRPTYRLPLAGLPRLDSLDVRALLARVEGPAVTSSLGGASHGYHVIEVRKSDWKPDTDFEVQPPASPLGGLRSGNLVLLRVAPALPTEPEEIRSLLVLLDTSASRSLGHRRQVETTLALARALAAGMGADTPLAVACFDQTVRLVYEGAAGGFGDDEARAIEQNRALGASDLASALRWAAAREGVRYERVLLISDGVATAGQIEPEQLREAARSLAPAGVRRLDALAAGGLRDDASLRRLVTAGLPQDGVVCEADQPLYEIGDRLTRATRSGLAVAVPGAAWVWPSKLDAVQPGDVVHVYADLPADRPVALQLDGQPVALGELGACERPLLERAWVKARLDRLEALRSDPGTDPDVRAGLRKQALDLSIQHRVLCPATALLILETEADYARHRIDRRALADILTVGLGGLEVLHRSAPADAPAPTPPAAPKPKGSPSPMMAKKAEATRSRRADLTREGLVEPDGFAAAAASLDDEDDERTMSPAPELGAPFEESESAYSPDEGAAAEQRLTMDAMPAEESREAAPTRSMPGRPAAAPSPAMMAAPRVARSASTGAPPPPPAFGPPAAFAPPPAMARSAPSDLPVSPLPMAPSPAAVAPPSPAPESAPPSLLRRIASAVTEVFARPGETAAAAPGPAPTPPPTKPPHNTAATAAPAAPPPRTDGPGAALPAWLAAGAWTGPFLEVMTALQAGDVKRALALALAWLEREPGDVLALVSVAQTAEVAGDLALAARACGSLIDLYPSRADLRRFAGERLEKFNRRDSLELAIDTYRKAVESRPDHPSGHRLLGLALLRAGRPAEAFEVLAAAQARRFDAKFPGIERILAEDLGLAAAAWIRAEPARRDELRARVTRARATLEEAPSVRFVLVWETDANDVDFHIHDALGGHAYYASKVLPSGGELYADVTQGYGPECFTIRLPPGRRPYPYRLQAHYFRRGPMGYGMGTLQILEHDGQGRLAFEDRPYIVMADGATVELGHIHGPLPFAEG